MFLPVSDKVLTQEDEVRIALELIEEYHRNQKSKDGADYKLHLISVKDILKQRFSKMKQEEIKALYSVVAFETDKSGFPRPVNKSLYKSNEEFINTCYIVALLHDILEDTPCTIKELEVLGFNDTHIQAIIAVTKIKADKLDDYETYFKAIKENPVARQVKIADLIHNSNLQRLGIISETDLERTVKYLKRLSYLLAD